MSIIAIIGSNYRDPVIAGITLQKEIITTSLGNMNVYRLPAKHSAYVMFRHGLPYEYLPHQIPYELQAEVLHQLECKALLLTSSVGVLGEHLPLFTPLLANDLLMLDNRLPDGRICTLRGPKKKHMHLVFDEGPFSCELNKQFKAEFARCGITDSHEVTYAYFAGPRTKTSSENRWFSKMGADVNSMTMGPEVVLANELGIPTAALLVGHKYSLAATKSINDSELADTITKSKHELEKWVIWFLQHIKPPPFGNMLYQVN